MLRMESATPDLPPLRHEQAYLLLQFKGAFHTSQRRLLREPTYLNHRTRNKYNVNKFYNRKFSNRGVANHTPKTFTYKGEIYKNIGEEGHFMEFSGKDGKRIKKHKFKDIVIEEKPSRKKFEAAAEKVVACG